MGDRCTGDCCRRFALWCGPEELERLYQARCAWARGEGVKGERMVNDIEIIQPMVRYLGSFTTDANGREGNHASHFYACKLYSHEHRECTIYEQRPRMCRSYPNGRRCNYDGCTWTAARSGNVDQNGTERSRADG